MAKTPEVVSHWHHSTEGLSTSALEFYSSVERSLNVKKVPIKAERIDWREAGLLSTKREYLRLSHDRFVFDVCAAPFGQDFFFSWWLGRRQREFTANSLGLAAGAFALLVGSVVVLGIFKGLLVFVLLLLAAIVADRNGAFDGAIDSALASLPFVARPTSEYSIRSLITRRTAVRCSKTRSTAL